MRIERDLSDIKWRKFIVMQLIALLLLLSWLFDPTRSVWLSLDEAVFRFFNESLRDGGDGWRLFWAETNRRLFDAFSALLLLSFFIIEAARDGRKRITRNLAMISVLSVTIGIAAKFGELLPVVRPSATLIYDDVFRLSEWATEFRTKDASGDTFPGDHGVVLFIIAGFALHYLRRPLGLGVLFLSLFIVLPRVVSGAHWLTDEIVGAVAVGLIILAWFLATPLATRLIDIADVIWAKLLGKIFRVSGIT